ncbi:MAG: SEL1-like repeat protein, partial [Halomonadaceae bacterium]|nr:SEL1-like repeat protein [Halomonadaceae bacterium]
MKRTTQAIPSTPTLRLSAALVLAAWLSGCAVQQEPSQRTHAPPIPQEYQAWFQADLEPPMDAHDWSRINNAQEKIANGRIDAAIEQLKPMALERELPPALYEMAKLYDQGIGVEENPAEAARLYGLAIERPSSMRGHASLN